MKEKDRIRLTKSLTEGWNRHLVKNLGEGSRDQLVAQVLRNKLKNSLPGGDGVDDAMPAGGTDDDLESDALDQAAAEQNTTNARERAGLWNPTEGIESEGIRDRTQAGINSLRKKMDDDEARADAMKRQQQQQQQQDNSQQQPPPIRGAHERSARRKAAGQLPRGKNLVGDRAAAQPGQPEAGSLRGAVARAAAGQQPDAGQQDPMDNVEVSDGAADRETAWAIGFLDQMLDYKNFRSSIGKYIRGELKKSLSKVQGQQSPAPRGAAPAPVEFSEEYDSREAQASKQWQPTTGARSGTNTNNEREAVYKKTANMILSRVETAIAKALPANPQALFKGTSFEKDPTSLREALFPMLLEVCREEHTAILNESKRKLVIEIKR